MASKTAVWTMAIARPRVRAQLLAEHPAARHARRVIHAAGVDGHLVPVAHALHHAAPRRAGAS
jgi:hypothetical protein